MDPNSKSPLPRPPTYSENDAGVSNITNEKGSSPTEATATGYRSPTDVSPLLEAQVGPSTSVHDPQAGGPERHESAYGKTYPEAVPYTDGPGHQQSPIFATQSSQLVTNVVNPRSLTKFPALVDCKICGNRSITTIRRVIGNANHATGIAVFFFSGVLFWIPYLIDCLKDVNHQCSHCGVLIATWHKTGRTEVYQ